MKLIVRESEVTTKTFFRNGKKIEQQFDKNGKMVMERVIYKNK